MLEHGGRLRLAAREYDISLENWIDLSTGINPDVYPVPPIAPQCWNRLPEDNDGLEAAAARFYNNERLIPLPGSQAAIQSLPALFPGIALACIAPVYEEHPHAWENAGNPLLRLPSLPLLLAAKTPNILLCNPNNPTGQAFPRDEVIAAAENLRKRNGWLIVDEAFADPEPENTVVELAGSAEAPNLLVLRSLGKFFGLAGARVGFLFGAQEKLQGLREIIGPWPLSHPSRFVAREALNDPVWQANARERLADASRRLAALLAPLGEVRRTALFCSIATSRVAELYDHLARRAILTRRFDHYGLLRVGLPGNESDWRRLADSIAES
ncbi:MAG: threonine-phosphate decarboxylase CobD [Candidatus Accumulibacter sp.]|nr:threonine-phosphate decarboxylase CobD [Accumulibacter sp.]